MVDEQEDSVPLILATFVESDRRAQFDVILKNGAATFHRSCSNLSRCIRSS